MTHTRNTKGFTIVELMVSLAVAAILMGVALPAFNDFIRQRTMASRINDLVLAVTYARSEAVRRGQRVSLERIGADDDNEWGGGYCVVLAGSDCDDVVDVLRQFEPMDDNVTFNATGALHGVQRLTFNGRGLLVGAIQGRIELCHGDEAVDPGRAIDISATGRADSQELECHP
jgi:type IV fimbrial biogenesis protein FimT